MIKNSNKISAFEGLICPIPLWHQEKILLGHGSGGRMTQGLIEKVFLPRFNNQALNAGNDFASVSLIDSATLTGSLTISTDAHIVNPIFFPGGDIGRLAISGTVNDISMSGGKPLYVTASFIIEEGLPIEVLERIATSMKNTAEEAGVKIIAGDTKVAEKNKVDKIFISTTGIGWIPPNRVINGQSAKPGDTIIISGTIGDHGIAVLAERGKLGFRTKLKSDVAPLNTLIEKILSKAPNVHVLRDPTRGGLATTLNEIANQSKVLITINEKEIPIRKEVLAACEMLGFDPLYVANEGKLIVILPPEQAEDALQAMQTHPYGKMAKIIGFVEKPSKKGRVLLNTIIGGTRIIDTLAGEMLPRIC